jgi:predicted acyl esterase
LLHRRNVIKKAGGTADIAMAQAGPSSIHTYKRQDALPVIPGQATEAVLMLQPISVLIRAGSRLRLSIAGADSETFARVPAVGDPVMKFTLGSSASILEIPVMEPK